MDWIGSLTNWVTNVIKTLHLKASAFFKISTFFFFFFFDKNGAGAVDHEINLVKKKQNTERCIHKLLMEDILTQVFKNTL